MRFNTGEYKDIQEIIAKAKLDPMDFTNVKKRGRLNIQHKNGAVFIFFRRTAMLLDENKQWKRESTYEVGPAKKLEAEGVDWKTVKGMFVKWVRTIG